MKQLILIKDKLDIDYLDKYKNVTIECMPVYTVKYMQFPKNLISEDDIIIITSQKAIRTVLQISSNIQKQRIICIGQITKKALIKSGIKNILFSSKNAKYLINDIKKNIGKNENMHYLRSNFITMDIRKHLTHDYKIKDIISYKIIYKDKLDSKMIQLIKSANYNSWLGFLSSKSANIFLNLAKKEGLSQDLKNLNCIAISKNVEDILNQIAWRSILTAPEHSIESVVKAINEQSY